MKKWFLQRKPREQVLVAVFVLLAGLTWLLAAKGRIRRGFEAGRSARIDLAAQQLWLDRRAVIETQAAAAVRSLDPKRTYDATRLVTTLTALAAGAGLAPAIDPPAKQPAAQFTFHQVRVSFQKASLASLLKLSDELAKQSPYLSVEQITVQSDHGAPDALSATLVITAAQPGPAKP